MQREGGVAGERLNRQAPNLPSQEAVDRHVSDVTLLGPGSMHDAGVGPLAQDGGVMALPATDMTETLRRFTEEKAPELAQLRGRLPVTSHHVLLDRGKAAEEKHEAAIEAMYA